MSENTHTLTAADFADILTTTLAMTAEAGLSVGVQNRPVTETRPAGLLLFISGLSVDAQGHKSLFRLPGTISIARQKRRKSFWNIRPGMNRRAIITG